MGIHQGRKKIAAAQADQNLQAAQVGGGFYIGNDQVFDADALRAIVPLILQINILEGADGDIERVNAGEIEAEPGFEFVMLLLSIAMGLLRQSEAERENIRLALGVFHDVEFAQIEPDEGEVQFALRQRVAVVFDMDFRDDQKRGAAETGRVVNFQILN